MIDLNNLSFDLYRMTLNEIRFHIDSAKVFRDYLGILPISNLIIRSPFRKDNKASFSIFFSDKHNTYLWMDHATGERGDVFDLVAKIKNISIKEAINLVFSEDHEAVKAIRRLDIIKSKKEEDVTSFKRRNWMQCDELYWSKFNINGFVLEYYNVFPITHYLVNGVIRHCKYPTYVYVEFKDGID